MNEQPSALSPQPSALSSAYQLRERLAGRRIGLVCSGGNSSLAHLRQALARDAG
jgi:hypothetical protein